MIHVLDSPNFRVKAQVGDDTKGIARIELRAYTEVIAGGSAVVG